MHRYSITVLMILVSAAVSACSKPMEHLLAGETMGTTYHIKVVAKRSLDAGAVQTKVDQCLERINQSMSTYRPDSEISRFNALTQPDTPFKVTPDFMQVMRLAGKIHKWTGGAWDGTVNPLVNLWGFGEKGPIKTIPAAEDIAAAIERVGFDHIVIDPAGFLTKKTPDVTVDLASIAKGYGVDQVAMTLKAMGFNDFLVEIGGEVYAVGHRLDGKSWRVGINRPQAEAAADAVYKVVPLNDSAMATSGDYRNFYEISGHSYSHIIDPRTGYPIQNGVVSASVIADSCTLADGLATALMVMGPEKGIALLDGLSGVEGMIIVHRTDGTFENIYSKGMHEKVEK